MRLFCTEVDRFLCVISHSLKLIRLDFSSLIMVEARMKCYADDSKGL